MINFIKEFWLETLLSSLISLLIYIIKEYRGLKLGMISLLRNEIIRIYEKHIKLGHCPSYMKKNINELYTSYHKLGGNGMITSMVEEIYKLPNE